MHRHQARFDYRASTGLGETESWKEQTKSCVHQDPGKRFSNHKGDGDRPTYECLIVPCRGMGWQWPTVEMEALSAGVLENVSWPKSSWMSPLAPLQSFPSRSESKEFAYDVGNLGSIPGSGRSHREENSYALQYSCLENSMDRGAWQAIVHVVTKSQT